LGSNADSIQKVHEEFECQRCGRCCKKIIKGNWIEVHGEVLEIWKKTPSLIHHPFYHTNLREFMSAEHWFYKASVREVWNFLEAEEKRIESYINEPVKFLWGGILIHCPFLERNENIYLCLIHGDTKPHTCRDWPGIGYKDSEEEAKSVGCKGLEILEATRAAKLKR